MLRCICFTRLINSTRITKNMFISNSFGKNKIKNSASKPNCLTLIKYFINLKNNKLFPFAYLGRSILDGVAQSNYALY